MEQRVETREREEERSGIREFWGRFSANKAAVISLYVIIGLGIASILADYIAPYDPYAFDIARRLEPPSLQHPFGLDHLGRDILSRIIHGGRYSMGIAYASVLLGAAIGVLLGVVSGYYGGWVDDVIQRFTDALLSLPTLLLAIALVTVLGLGLQSLILSIGISTVPVYIRLARSLALQERNMDYVVAAKIMGKGDAYIMARHILPNIVSPILVQSTYYMGLTILIASGLGFLGLGVQPPTPEWGSMIGLGRNYIYAAPHVVAFPGIFILITSLAFNILGDGLRDALDPRMAKYIKRGV